MNQYQKKCEFLESKIKNTRNQIRALLENPHSDRKSLLELQFRLANQTGKLAFIRPNSAEDISYREEQLYNFTKKIKTILPDSEGLIFHASPIYNAEKIIKSGRIMSGRDLWGFATSGDPKGKFSITTKEQLRTSVLGHSDLNAFIGFLPAGVIFVLKAQNDAEYQMAKDDAYMKNVNFKQNPAHLYGLITTPENQSRVKDWLNHQSYQFPVYDYKGFIKHIASKTAQKTKLSQIQKQI